MRPIKIIYNVDFIERYFSNKNQAIKYITKDSTKEQPSEITMRFLLRDHSTILIKSFDAWFENNKLMIKQTGKYQTKRRRYK